MAIDPESTANLKLPYILPSQAQKHVTHNEAIRMLDALMQPSVADRDRTSPPAGPAEGDRHLVAAGATGEWADHDHHIAAFMDGAWFFFVPRRGWICHVASEERLCLFDGAGWTDALASLAHALQNLDRLGIGTTADAANPLAAKLDNVLFSARPAAEGGSGDLRVKVNKEEASDTASFLFQTGWSGRAEFGLAGSDSFSVKVSADGEAWKTSLSVDNASGYVGIGTEQPLTPLHLHAGGAVPDPVLVSSDDFLISKSGGAAGFSGAVASAGAGGRMVFKGTRARGTVAAPAVVAEGDEVISLLGAIYDGEAVRATAQIALTADGPSAPGAAPQRVSFWTGPAASRVERLRIDRNGAVFLPAAGTTAGAANAVLNAGSSPANQLLRSTSSLDYKSDVEPVDPVYSQKLMALTPIWYRSKAAADRPDWSWWGFAAEEVAAIDPRLVSWGYREGDYERVAVEEEGIGGSREEWRLKPGAQKKPDGVAYDRFVVHHHVVIMALQEELVALRTRVEALQGASTL